MDEWFHHTPYNGCYYLFMLGLKLIHIRKRGPWPKCVDTGQLMSFYVHPCLCVSVTHWSRIWHLGICENDNFQCKQWWTFHQNDSISVSVVLVLVLNRKIVPVVLEPVSIPVPVSHVIGACLTHLSQQITEASHMDLSMSACHWWNADVGARSRYQEQGQIITSHSIYGM